MTDSHPDFFAIPRSLIVRNSVTGFDLFIRTGDRLVLYRSGRAPFDPDRLLRSHIDTLYVRRADVRAFEGYVEQHLAAIVEDTAISPAEKADLVYNAANTSLERLYQDPTDADALRHVRTVSALTVEQILRSRSILDRLILLASHDYFTYTHSVNVAVYATALGARLGRFSREELHVLGMAAMLHDIGKTRVDDVILKKKGRLDEEEWKVMRRHPIWGAKILRQTGALPEDGIRVVLEHHEAYDGSGYPSGARGEEISLMGRVVKIADVFDALTGDRPYRDPLTAFHALATMRRDMAAQFDQALLREFILLLGGVWAAG